jgi:very-short-patch-repair endonuclease
MTRFDVDVAIAARAERQHGCFSLRQAYEQGADRTMADRRIRAGRWLQEAEDVFRLPGSPKSWKCRLWIAALALGPEAVVSHEAAAALHGLATFRAGPVTLTVPHADVRIGHVGTCHQSRRLYPEHITVIDGLRVTTVARTLIDLAADYRMARMEHVVDDALAARKLNLPNLCVTFDDIACRGRRGTKLMRRILQARQPGYVAPQSRAESLLLRVLRQGGLPRPVLQLPHPAPEFDGRRVDGAYVAARVLIEVDSRRWHTQAAALQRDHERDFAAKRVGWDTYRFCWADLTERPEWVVEQLAIALSKAA